MSGLLSSDACFRLTLTVTDHAAKPRPSRSYRNASFRLTLTTTDHAAKPRPMCSYKNA